MASQPAPPLAPESSARFQAWIAGSAGARSRSASGDPQGRAGSLGALRRGAQPAGSAPGRSAAPGLRAAFASFYAPLHFLDHLRGGGGAAAPLCATGSRAWSISGAGTGAIGAALALAAGAPAVLALDRSAWALGEARRTFAALGVRGRTRRAQLPSGVPRSAPGDLVAAGWILNECRPEARERACGRLSRALSSGRAGARARAPRARHLPLVGRPRRGARPGRRSRPRS